jgi:two-component system, sensor histidine kinase and response regulator
MMFLEQPHILHYGAVGVVPIGRDKVIDKAIRVLLVEDCERDATLVLRELERGGYTVTSRRIDSPEGLRDALVKGVWDLVIADHSMPRFSGIKPLSIVREAGLQAPFIFVSGTLSEDAALKAIKAGAQDYIPKGDLKGLLPAVQRELREKLQPGSLGYAGAGVERQKEALDGENRRIRDELHLRDRRTSNSPLASQQPRILLVDDMPENLLALEVILGDLEADLVKATSGEVALRHLLDQQFALILLDVRMPGLSGVDTAIFIRNRARSRHTPIIFLTANYDNPEEVARGYAVGAVDYISKPFVPEVLKAKVRTFLELYQKNEEIALHAHACEDLSRELEMFSSSVAHDLRAPLRTIEGFAGALVEDHGPSLRPEAKAYLDRISSAAKRMDALIRDLLAYSHVARLRMEPRKIDLAALLADVQSEWVDMIKEKGADVLLEEPILAVSGHELTLRQALSNLLGNALKFTREGVPPSVRIRTERKGDRVRVVVEDKGIGIPTEDQDRIFRPFERLHGQDRYEGTGMGLAIVRRAIERMGGIAGVESKPGHGSRFFVELPPAP